jgi:ubiquinone/menaquinone biosynthesis C-methylase UbiE
MDYTRIYEYRFRDVPDNQKAAAWRNIARHVMGLMPGARRVLDPSAGRCEFVNHADAAEIWAVDMEEKFLAQAKPGVKTVVGDIFDVTLPQAYFDGVFVSNFLEHLPSAEHAAAFLGLMREALVPGGRLVVMGPNFKYCGDEYFDCIDHKLILTHHAVEELLHSEGFKIRSVHPQFLPFSFRRHRLPFLEALVKIYLRIPLAWKLLGKQFLIVAEKPGDRP